MQYIANSKDGHDRIMGHPDLAIRVNWIQPPIQWVLVGLSLWVKQSGRKADHSHPSSAEDKNEWSFTSNPPLCLGKHRGNFTFTFTWVMQETNWTCIQSQATLCYVLIQHVNSTYKNWFCLFYVANDSFIVRIWTSNCIGVVQSYHRTFNDRHYPSTHNQRLHLLLTFCAHI
jgi:hypothetical protein